MTQEDKQAVAAVLREKAAAFWLEKTQRTVLLHLKHDTVPTGPPVRTPPHHLKGEEAMTSFKQKSKRVNSKEDIQNGLVHRLRRRNSRPTKARGSGEL